MNRLIPLTIVLFFLLPASIPAHPGKTGSVGCHFCRTNCDKWGVPKGVKHCHEGKEQAVPLKIKFEAKDRDKSKDNSKYPG